MAHQECKYVLFSGASGSGKSSYIQRFLGFIGDEACWIQLPFKLKRSKKQDWKAKCFSEARVTQERLHPDAKLCLIEVIVPGPLEISFANEFDAFNAWGATLFVRTDTREHNRRQAV